MKSVFKKGKIILLLMVLIIWVNQGLYASNVIYSYKDREFASILDAIEYSNQVNATEPVIPILPNESGPGVNVVVSENDIMATESEIFIHDGIKFKKGKALGKFSLSGYCSCKKCTNGTGLTYSGKPVRANHTVAADKKVLPIGTYIIIEDSTENEIKNYDGVYQVEDIGGGVKNNHIDIYEPTHDLACMVTYHGRAYGNVFLAEKIDN